MAASRTNNSSTKDALAGCGCLIVVLALIVGGIVALFGGGGSSGSGSGSSSASGSRPASPAPAVKSSFVSAVWQEPTRSGVGLDVKLKVSNPGGSEVSSYAVDDSVTTYSVTDSSGTTIEQGRVRLTDDVPAHGAVYAATDARFTWGDEVSSGQAVTLHAGGISKKLIVPKEPEEPEEPETNGALERSVPSAPASAPARTAPGDRSSSSGSSSSGSSSSGSSSSGQLLSPSGRPYEAGQFCPRKYLGMTTTAGNGARITCQPQSGRNHWVAG